MKAHRGSRELWSSYSTRGVSHMYSRLRTSLVFAAAAALITGSAGLALASDVNVAVVDITAPTTAVSIEAGAEPLPITITATVTGNQVGTATFEVFRDWNLSGGTFVGSNPQEFSVAPRAGGDPDTVFNTTGQVTVASTQPPGDFTLTVGVEDITNSNATGAKLAAGTKGSYVVTVTAPPPPANTAPVVAVTGFTSGTTVEIGAAEPTPACSVVDAEDTGESASPLVDRSGVDEHGLGTVTVTCSYEDGGGLEAGDSKSYTLVDTTKPGISYAISPAVSASGWYTSAPTVTFSCTDAPGSGVKSCVADDADPASAGYTLGESALPQSVSGTATDWAGNQQSAEAVDLYVDLSDPTVSLTGAIADGDTFYWGSVPTAPVCEGDDAISGLASCVLSGYGTGVGDHTVTATATDNAGRTRSTSIEFTVAPWTLEGFFQPVNAAALNTVKAGSTVPLKFTASKGDEAVTDVAELGATFTAVRSACPNEPLDPFEGVLSTGSTTLRYDSTAQQWIQNWATPKSAVGTCWDLTLTLADGTTTTADFKLK